MDKPLKVRIKANIQCDAVYSSTVLGSVPFTVSAIPSKSIDYYKINIEYVKFLQSYLSACYFGRCKETGELERNPHGHRKYM